MAVIHRLPAAAASTRRATTCASESTASPPQNSRSDRSPGTLALRNKDLSGQVDVASAENRLFVNGTGHIALTPHADSELTFRFHDSYLDPYVRLFVPKLSPYMTAVATGSVRVAGDLGDVDRLLVDGTVDKVEMRLFDPAARNAEVLDIVNAAPLRMTMDQHRVVISDLQLVGEDTRLRGAGTIDLHNERIDVEASGDVEPRRAAGRAAATCAASGRAALAAAIDGQLREPDFSGTATVTDGRIRHFCAAQLARRHQRHDPLRRARRPPRRRDGDDGRRARAVRRPHRLRRLRPATST